MIYPEDFKSRVIKAWPNCSQIEQCLVDGDPFLGKLLSHGAKTSFSFYEILEAKSLEELKQEARKMEEIFKLSEEWKKLYEEQKDKK